MKGPTRAEAIPVANEDAPFVSAGTDEEGEIETTITQKEETIMTMMTQATDATGQDLSDALEAAQFELAEMQALIPEYPQVSESRPAWATCVEVEFADDKSFIVGYSRQTGEGVVVSLAAEVDRGTGELRWLSDSPSRPYVRVDAVEDHVSAAELRRLASAVGDAATVVALAAAPKSPTMEDIAGHLAAWARTVSVRRLAAVLGKSGATAKRRRRGVGWQFPEAIAFAEMIGVPLPVLMAGKP